MSRPTRARGLKPQSGAPQPVQIPSRPTRARGLKLAARLAARAAERVAPHAGAWIETRTSPARTCDTSVAPHAGAWIETGKTVFYVFALPLSRPTRARGLKPAFPVGNVNGPRSRPTRARGLKRIVDESTYIKGVAPHAGAWIETRSLWTANLVAACRAPRGRVD